MSGDLDGKSVLVTGGTGTFGRAFFRHVLREYKPRRLICFSRDEFKQWELRGELRAELGEEAIRCMRWFIGDVRDLERLRMAFRPVDIVVHAAALKHVPTGEVNPIEVIKTNVMGAENVVTAAIEQGVERVMALSSDQACAPINLYGASKLCAEKLFVAANALSGDGGARFAAVRYGNVIGSRGSVVELFFEQARSGGPLTITDRRMTRFWLRIERGVEFVCECLGRMRGGEIFVPLCPSGLVVDLAEAVSPGVPWVETGIRPGEKMHESLISDVEARTTVAIEGGYIIEPEADWYERQHDGGTRVEGRNGGYQSDTNNWLLGAASLRALVHSADPPVPAPDRAAGHRGGDGDAQVGGGLDAGAPDPGL